MWRKAGWPAGDDDGVFIQLQAPGGSSSSSSGSGNRLWWMGVEGKLPSKPLPLAYDSFALLPPLLR